MSMQVATINLVNSVEQEEFEAGLLSESYSVSTKKGKKFKLPAVFDAEVREDLRTERGTTETPDWETALDEDLLDLLRNDDVAGARLRLRRALGLPGVPDFSEAAS